MSRFTAPHDTEANFFFLLAIPNNIICNNQIAKHGYGLTYLILNTKLAISSTQNTPECNEKKLLNSKEIFIPADDHDHRLVES